MDAAPVDMAALEELLVRFSELVVEHPWIKELDINPLLASPERLLALDARVVLHDAGMRKKTCRRPRSVRIRRKYIGRVEDEGWQIGHDPSDPSRRRAGDDRVPQQALGAHACTCAISSR